MSLADLLFRRTQLDGRVNISQLNETMSRIKTLGSVQPASDQMLNQANSEAQFKQQMITQFTNFVKKVGYSFSEDQKKLLGIGSPETLADSSSSFSGKEASSSSSVREVNEEKSMTTKKKVDLSAGHLQSNAIRALEKREKNEGNPTFCLTGHQLRIIYNSGRSEKLIQLRKDLTTAMLADVVENDDNQMVAISLTDIVKIGRSNKKLEIDLDDPVQFLAHLFPEEYVTDEVTENTFKILKPELERVREHLKKEVSDEESRSASPVEPIEIKETIEISSKEKPKAEKSDSSSKGDKEEKEVSERRLKVIANAVKQAKEKLEKNKGKPTFSLTGTQLRSIYSRFRHISKTDWKDIKKHFSHAYVPTFSKDVVLKVDVVVTLLDITSPRSHKIVEGLKLDAPVAFYAHLFPASYLTYKVEPVAKEALEWITTELEKVKDHLSKTDPLLEVKPKIKVKKATAKPQGQKRPLSFKEKEVEKPKKVEKAKSQVNLQEKSVKKRPLSSKGNEPKMTIESDESKSKKQKTPAIKVVVKVEPKSEKQSVSSAKDKAGTEKQSVSSPPVIPARRIIPKKKK